MSLKGLIFDLDGVIVFTDQYHYKAWKQMADEKGIYFDQEINNRLRGVSRMDSLEIILERYEGHPLSDEEKQKMAEEKNDIYKKLLEQMTPADVSDEVKETLDELHRRDICFQSDHQAGMQNIFLREQELSTNSMQFRMEQILKNPNQIRKFS